MNEEISSKVLKTGTLTLGLVCKEGLVIAADNRQSYAGSGGGVSYIAGQAKKILPIKNNMLVTTAGTASDSRRAVDIIRAELRLKELKTKVPVTVKETASLISNLQFSNIRQFSVIPSIAHFLLAGYDEEGVHLFEISPDGYLQESVTYIATGSGIMQAHPILDSDYKPNMSLNDGIALAIKSLRAAIKREPSVGDGYNIFTISKGEVKEVQAKDLALVPEDKKVNLE